MEAVSEVDAVQEDEVAPNRKLLCPAGPHGQGADLVGVEVPPPGGRRQLAEHFLQLWRCEGEGRHEDRPIARGRHRVPRKHASYRGAQLATESLSGVAWATGSQ